MIAKLMQYRAWTYALSLIVVGASVAAIVRYGVAPGIDFTGGTLMEVGCVAARDVTQDAAQTDADNSCTVPSRDVARDILAAEGFRDALVQVTDSGTLMLRYAQSTDEQNDAILAQLRARGGEDLRALRVDFVGGSVSAQLTRNAIEAIIVAIIVILLYIAWAFRSVSTYVSSWQYGIGAIIALVHDIVIVVGVFALLGHFFGVTVGIPFVAALLTVLGYSVNDTIVVYDRIRENILRHGKKGKRFVDIVHMSIRETIARSLNTSMTVLVVLLAVMLWGGASLFYFALALFIGVVAGTYSSIFVATALLVTMAEYKKR